MSFKDDMEEDLTIFFNLDEFAETGQYTSKEAGSTVAVRALIDYGTKPGQDVADTNSDQARAHLIKSELPAPAKYGDSVVIDGVEWNVIRQSNADEMVVVVDLRRDPRNRYKP